MNLEIEEIKHSTVLRIKEKRLDAHNSPEFKDRILKLLETGNINIIIEMSEVRFVDSSGLGALLSGFKNAASLKGGLILTGLQSQVKSMFELTRLHRVFKIYPTLEEALGQN
ncbi:MAG: STAS domain-containing protein [Methylococcales bacterium]